MSKETHTEALAKLASSFGLKAFLKYLQEHMSRLRIAKAGSNYCDICTTMKGAMDKMRDKAFLEKEAIKKHHDEHHAIAHIKFLF